MKANVYIDGREGTTGLQIYDRLSGREDINLLLIDDDKRKDLTERKKYLNGADIVFLCLPDAAAVEAVGLIDNPNTRVIDASTAHRTAAGWVYGFPELLAGQRQRLSSPSGWQIRAATQPVSQHLAPLVAMDILPADYPVTCFSLTGYSGGGKKMIAEYEGEGKAEGFTAPESTEQTSSTSICLRCRLCPA